MTPLMMLVVMDDDVGLFDSGERGHIHVCTVLGHGCHNNANADTNRFNACHHVLMRT